MSLEDDDADLLVMMIIFMTFNDIHDDKYRLYQTEKTCFMKLICFKLLYGFSMLCVNRQSSIQLNNSM